MIKSAKSKRSLAAPSPKEVTELQKQGDETFNEQEVVDQLIKTWEDQEKDIWYLYTYKTMFDTVVIYQPLRCDLGLGLGLGLVYSRNLSSDWALVDSSSESHHYFFLYRLLHWARTQVCHWWEFVRLTYVVVFIAIAGLFRGLSWVELG